MNVGCDYPIEKGWSGYCKCTFGNVMYKGCTNATHTTCAKACELAGKFITQRCEMELQNDNVILFLQGFLLPR